MIQTGQPLIRPFIGAAMGQNPVKAERQRPPGAAFSQLIAATPSSSIYVFGHPLHLFSDKWCEFVIVRPEKVAIYVRPRRARWWWIIIAAWWPIIAEAWVTPTWQAFSDWTPWFMAFLHLTFASS
jgi:hypothetical protein